MQLKSIEIKGFKSFGDKVTLHFNKGVTGIVGPNGCGKSNVVDAIRWVLGEQKSRMLRSDKMESVIFNGTKNRKASNLAEVSINFSNTKNILSTEYSEVTITRKLFRTGESEYLLNGVSCRLKDIQNLLLDTGIGSDSYAIMELKMIDEILNDKENSRRQIFEEASGVSKYKIRKKETLSKLDAAQQDIDRIEDILFEIEKNLKSLQQQAKKTEKYFETKSKYQEASIELSWYGLQNLDTDLDEIKKQESALTDNRIRFDAQILEKEAIIEKEKAVLVEKEKQLSFRQRASNELLNQIRNYESEKKISNEKLKMLQEREQRLRLSIDKDKQACFQFEGQLFTLEPELDAIKNKVSDTEKEVSVSNLSLDEIKTEHTKAQAQQNEIQQELRLYSDEAAKIEKELLTSTTQLNAFKNEFERTILDLDARKNEVEMLGNQEKIFSSNLVSKEAELNKLQKAEIQLQQRLEQIELQIKKTRTNLSDLQRVRDSKSNEHSLIKGLVDNMEGYPESLKYLKKQTKWIPNAQLLSDVISVKPEYKAGIETFLENYLNYYVVPTVSDALAGIELLSQASKGRAGFIVLEKFVDISQHQAVIIPGCIPALEIIETDFTYNLMVQHFLGHVFIIQDGNINEQKLAQLATENPNKVFIHESGKFNIQHLTLSGGSVGLFEGKRIGRKRNLESLTHEISDSDQKINQLQLLISKFEGEFAETKNQFKKEAIQQVTQEIKNIQQELVRINTLKDQHNLVLSKTSGQQDDLKSKTDALNANIVELSPLLIAINKEKEDCLQKSYERKSEFEAIQQKLQETSSNVNRSTVIYHETLNKFNATERELIYKTGQITALKESLIKFNVDLTESLNQITELVNSSDFSDDDLVSMYQEKEEVDKGVKEIERLCDQIKTGIDDTFFQIKQIRKFKDNNEQGFLTLVQKKNEIHIQQNNIFDRLSIEFEVDKKLILKFEPISGLSMDALTKITKELKQKTENYGPINPMALEAYNEIKERFDFIEAQRIDLLKAKESLLATISEIDITAKAKFLESFTIIRDNFMNVFRSLFTNEDACDLVLSDPTSPLESTIQIIARPKGKKPLSINQLSGGEKTLTATALLFAIYLYKPAPFCIFDEVDAPLDDNNIDKFNNIIREFSNDSQFIIVTHNKKTISTTDIIYGVTMIEQGISRVVPVDLREWNPTN